MTENIPEENIKEVIEEIPSIDDLKNKEHVNDLSEEQSVPNDDEDLTASKYKKSLGKKVSEFTPEEKAKYMALSQKKKRKKDKEVEEVKLSQEQEKEESETKNTLYNQLYVLKQKFPDGCKNIHLDPDMSLSVLEEKKALILKIITDKNAHKVVFESLLLMCRTGERGLHYFDVDVLDGYSDEVKSCETDICEILKELIDMGQIDTSFLTPELRLMIVMSGCAVRTMEKNLAKKKVPDLVEDSEA